MTRNISPSIEIPWGSLVPPGPTLPSWVSNQELSKRFLKWGTDSELRYFCHTPAPCPIGLTPWHIWENNGNNISFFLRFGYYTFLKKKTPLTWHFESPPSVVCHNSRTLRGRNLKFWHVVGSSWEMAPKIIWRQSL